MARIARIGDDVRSIILEESRRNPGISCRSLSKIIQKKVNIKISKSSINNILKQTGLSDKVGRKKKIKDNSNLSPELPDLNPQDLSIASATQGLLQGATLDEKPAVVPEPALEPIVNAPLPEEIHPPLFVDEKQQMSLPAAAEVPSVPPSVSQPPPEVTVAREGPLAEHVPAVSVFSDGERRKTLAGLVIVMVLDSLVQGTQRLAESISRRADADASIIQKRLQLNLLQEVLLSSGRIDVDYAPLESMYGCSLNAGVLKENNVAIEPFIAGSFTAELERITRQIFKNIRCFRITLSDGKTFCIDSQMHTVWSTLNIPHEFSTTAAELKTKLLPALKGEAPFVLFMAPGYDVPTKDFFYFLNALGNVSGGFDKCTLHGSASDEADVFQAPHAVKSCVFALWPWQFTGYRAVKKLGEFSSFTDDTSGRSLYRARIEMELLQPELNQRILANGYALKTNPEEKTKLVILSCGPQTEDAGAASATAYLTYWPNLDEAYRDFSRKVELFTYAGQTLGLAPASTAGPLSDTEETVPFLRRYAFALARYFREVFLPPSQNKMSRDILTSPMFCASSTVSRGNRMVKIVFDAGAAAYFKDLEYACLRLNERCLHWNELPVQFSVEKA
jgi:hypothetical protein